MSIPRMKSRRWFGAAAAPMILAGVAQGAESTQAPKPQIAPSRIVAIAPNSAEIICDLGACDRVVGVSKFCVYPPELLDRPKVGGLFDPDLERMAALRPDLIVMRGRNDAIAKLARELGITVYRDDTDSFAGIEACIRDLGELLHLTREAEALNEAMRTRVDALRNRVADRKRPRVLVTLSRRPEHLAEIMTAGAGSFVDEMLDIAGGDNVFGNVELAYPQISLESIITQRPEIIIELMPEVEMSGELRTRLKEQWRAAAGAVPAVRDDRVYFITSDNSLIPSPRYLNVVEEVSRLLHSEPYCP